MLATRRRWLTASSLLPAFLQSAPAAQAAPAATKAGNLPLTADIYKSIGVRPLINCRGTLTIISGSLELPEVSAAKQAAALRFVQMDELMDAIGARLGELTGAEFGMVSSGCAAGLAHATAACVTGGNPDLLVRVPDLTGFAKDEVIIPADSRNVYDQALRSVGVRIIEARNPAEYEAAFGPRTAMVYVFAGPRHDNGPLPYDTIYSIAKAKNVPVLVDAAAEILTFPNVHLQRGATLVGYSGGKCIRGPQNAGFIIGRKDLIQAAWVCAAPHHGHGRAMKISKEVAIGMLAAVEMWRQRNHAAEMKTWHSWLNNIAGTLGKLDGVKTAIREPRGLSNHTPGLSISWEPAQYGISGDQLAQILDTTEPRIALNATPNGVSIAAYMMAPGEDKIVAERIRQVLTAQRPAWKPEVPATPAADITGRWNVIITFAAGSSTHTLHLHQQGNKVTGTHQGDFTPRDLQGSISGSEVKLTSSIGEQHGAALTYRFSGRVNADSLSGTLNMGEYREATFTARRHSG